MNDPNVPKVSYMNRQLRFNIQRLDHEDELFKYKNINLFWSTVNELQNNEEKRNNPTTRMERIAAEYLNEESNQSDRNISNNTSNNNNVYIPAHTIMECGGCCDSML